MALMSAVFNGILYPLPYILVIWVLTYIHELSHFVAMRFFDVRVSRFSVGVWKSIVEFRLPFSGAMFSLKLIPIAGYVKPADRGVDDDQVIRGRNFFDDLSRWRRAVIVAAGPLASIMVFVVYMSVVLYSDGEVVRSSVVSTVVAGGPADAAGIHAGDRIVRLGHFSVSSARDVVDTLLTSGSEPVVVKVRNPGGAERYIMVQPKLEATPNRPGGATPHIGVVFSDSSVVRYGIGGSVVRSVVLTGQNTSMVFAIMRQVMLGGLSLKMVSGPVGTAEVVHHAVEGNGFSGLLYIGSVISLMIGIANLIPLVPMDGGRLFLIFIEACQGSRISETFERRFAGFGLGVIGAVFLISVWIDLFVGGNV